MSEPFELIPADACEVNGVNPVSCLADVLIRVQTHPASRIDELVGAHREPRNSELADAGRLSGSVQAG